MPTFNLITSADAARILGVSIKTVHTMVARGDLHEAAKAPGTRGARFFLNSEVQALRERRAARGQ